MLAKIKFIYTLNKDFRLIYEDLEAKLGSNYVEIFSSEIGSREIRIDVANLNNKQKAILLEIINNVSTVNINNIKNIINDIDYIVIFN